MAGKYSSSDGYARRHCIISRDRQYHLSNGERGPLELE